MPKREEATQGVEPKTIKKNPFEEKVKKYLGKVNGIDTETICECKCVKVAEPNQPKVDMAFVVFDDSDEENNLKDIGNVLIHFHTAPEKPTKQAWDIQLIAPEEDGEPTVLTMMEYTEI